MDKLKPCPFCGGHNIEINDVSEGYPWIPEGIVEVGCPDCGIWNQCFSRGEEEKAAEFWNRRANDG
mgnify:CR=1 FL=1